MRGPTIYEAAATLAFEEIRSRLSNSQPDSSIADLQARFAQPNTSQPETHALWRTDIKDDPRDSED